MEQSKRFDETYVECTECSHYWNDSCDGVPKDSVRPCTAYKATKKVDVLESVYQLKSEIKNLYIMIAILTAALLSHILSSLTWRF